MTQTMAREAHALAFPDLGRTVAPLGTSIPLSFAIEKVVMPTAIFYLSSVLSSLPVMLSAPLQTVPADVSSAQADDAGRLSADLVKELRKATGFTWEQLSKLLGVSRRSVHLWAAGGRMTAANEEAVARVLKEVTALTASSPAARRVELLALLDRSRASHASTGADINRPAPTYASGAEDEA